MSQRTFLARLLSCAWGGGDRPSHTSEQTASSIYLDAAALLSEHLTERDGQLGPEHLSQEFALLPCSESAKSTIVANGEHNKKKNRYTNVLPFDYNRVKLKEVDPETDYINASLCAWNSTAVTGVPGEVPCKYVATQGPLNCTIPDFWAMCIQNGLSSIVMLTRTMECRSQRCAQYFAEQPGVTVEHGNYSVTTLSLQQLNEDINIRQLMVTCKPVNGQQAEPQQHLITHYHYHLWPDHGVPGSTEPLRELSHNLWQQGSKSLAVHCSAGIGRTGTFIAADSLLRRLWAMAGSGMHVDKAVLKKALDVPSVICELRMMRSGMVQTAEQYGLVYEIVLSEALARKDALCKGTSAHNQSTSTTQPSRAQSTTAQHSRAPSSSHDRRGSQAYSAHPTSSSHLGGTITQSTPPSTTLSFGLESSRGGGEREDDLCMSRLPSTTLQDWGITQPGRENGNGSPPSVPFSAPQGVTAGQAGQGNRALARLPSATLQGWETQILRAASNSLPAREKRALPRALSTTMQGRDRLAISRETTGTLSGNLSPVNSWQLEQHNNPWGA